MTLGPKQFWISLREPDVGEWPPDLPVDQPLIDPQKRARKDLAEPTVAQAALDLLEARHEALRAIDTVLEQALAANGFEAMLRQALGHPAPGDPLQHSPTDLETELGSSDPAVASGARDKIENDLRMTVADFAQLMDVKAKADQTDPAEKPTREELTDVFAILVSARKVKHEYATWLAEEQAANLVYWTTLKARLPRWRASPEARTIWQQALRRRGETPHIDPDLVRPDDLRHPLSGDAAELWQARRDFIAGKLTDLAMTDLAGFDTASLAAVGVAATELELLAQQRDSSEDITQRLEQLLLTNEGFNYLLRIRRLAENAAPVLDEEWSDATAILVQVSKRLEFAEWQKEEREKRITLGLDYFKIPQPPPLKFPPPEPAPLPARRATEAARRAWRATLRARIEQEQSVVDAQRAAVSATEEELLPELRDTLPTSC